MSTEVVVHRLRADVNRYRHLIRTEQGGLGGSPLVLDGAPRRAHWSPPEVAGQPESLPEADFMKLGHGGLVLSPRAVEALREVLAPTGELLPVYLHQRVWSLWNVTEVLDCLDPERTVWRTHQGMRVHVKQYGFRPEALPRVSSVFKTHEERRGRIYTVSGRLPPARELRSVVERQGLTGLVFEEVWRGEAPEVPEPEEPCSTEDFPV